MAEITGYETGVPRTCPWCWEKATTIGEDGITGTTIPLHATCAMQMLLIRKRLAHGKWQPRRRPDLPLSLAWRRFFRWQRTSRRIAKSMKRLDGQRRLVLGSGDANHNQTIQRP